MKSWREMFSNKADRKKSEKINNFRYISKIFIKKVSRKEYNIIFIVTIHHFYEI